MNLFIAGQFSLFFLIMIRSKYYTNFFIKKCIQVHLDEFKIFEKLSSWACWEIYSMAIEFLQYILKINSNIICLRSGICSPQMDINILFSEITVLYISQHLPDCTLYYSTYVIAGCRTQVIAFRVQTVLFYSFLFL